MNAPAVSATGLVKHFPRRGSRRATATAAVRAVDGVELSVAPGECLAIVGESGCGKSTVARLLVGLHRPTAGQVFVGERTLSPVGNGPRSDRRLVQFVSQNPWSALNRRKTVCHVLSQPLVVHGLAGNREKRAARVHELLDKVGLDGSYLQRRVAELSGGELQRVTIARALAVDPQVLVLDEPTASLDVSVKAVLVNLLNDLRNDLNLAYVLITHELDIAFHVADQVAVMYLGEFVETGQVDEVLRAPQHPYTRALLASATSVSAFGRRPVVASRGEVPSADAVPSGCRYHPRCGFANQTCATAHPTLQPVGVTRFAACLRIAELPSMSSTSGSGKDANP